MNIFTLCKLYVGFRDARKVYEEEKGKEAPVWMSRKVIGSVLTFIALVALYFTGVEIDSDTINQLSDNLTNAITAIVAIYGIVMVIISAFKKKIEK